ncbi:MAG: flagellar basal-body rod protein FlgF [Nitrospirae bacterium]|uniref:flagellar basal-body rod protein FlgF n=1 Tax=Candidatus Magnetobacterium casense TaxID=1455061 RepID=UPI00058D1482|nr:flagellar basal-body rod protein FlgF [Candidatus Magnetobacterium casensis]MBF0339166.1 flagellar basal-body rod protein FlgF [Nitrospirota bacterium]
MYKGIYIAASGAIMKQRHMETVSNNLANAATYGFKEDGITFRDYLMSEFSDTGDEEQAKVGIGGRSGDGRIMTYLSDTYTDHSSGAMISTGNPLDLAIDGPGFFALEGDKYTRAGNFKLDSEGFITTAKGVRVLGSGGSIQVPNGKLEISASGDVAVDGTIIDRVRVVGFSDKAKLKKEGDTNYTSNEPAVESTSGVKQGFLEASNVNVVQEMVNMIELYREYESNQKMVQTFDEATSKVVSEMARL